MLRLHKTFRSLTKKEKKHGNIPINCKQQDIKTFVKTFWLNTISKFSNIALQKFTKQEKVISTNAVVNIPKIFIL